MEFLKWPAGVIRQGRKRNVDIGNKLKVGNKIELQAVEMGK